MELSEFEIDTDARLAVIETVLAGTLDLLIDQKILDHDFADSMRSVAPTIGLTHWAGLSAETSDALSAQRQEALERFLRLLQLRPAASGAS